MANTLTDERNEWQRITKHLLSIDSLYEKAIEEVTKRMREVE